MRIQRYVIATLLSISSIFFTSSTLAGNDYYFLYSRGELYNDAVACESYIKNNSNWFLNEIHLITKKYSSKSFFEAFKLTKNTKFKQFKEHVWNCSLYTKYTGATHYYREANISIFSLIINVELANETGIHDFVDIHIVEKNINDNIKVILASKKIKKP